MRRASLEAGLDLDAYGPLIGGANVLRLVGHWVVPVDVTEMAIRVHDLPARVHLLFHLEVAHVDGEAALVEMLADPTPGGIRSSEKQDLNRNQYIDIAVSGRSSGCSDIAHRMALWTRLPTPGLISRGRMKGFGS